MADISKTEHIYEYRTSKVRYWPQEAPEWAQNFGDFLTTLFMDRLFVLPSFPADAYHLIGSVISEDWIRWDLAALGVPVDSGLVSFWGCGLPKDKPLSEWAMKHARFSGVRGPLTRDVLGLPKDTPIGDPGLLTPLLHPVRRRAKNGSLCVVHIHDPKKVAEIKEETGAANVIRGGISGNQNALLQILTNIAEAEFVLSGSLHGAIVAAAYGVPFAFYDSGHIDSPFKWRDFSASVGLPCEFVKTVQEGKELYQHVLRKAYKPLPLLPILACAPFSVRHSMILKALQWDGHISEFELAHMVGALRDTNVDDRASIFQGQELWLHNGRESKQSAKTN